MTIGYIHACVRQHYEFHLGDLDTPVRGAYVEATRDGSQAEQVVVDVTLVVIQNYDRILEHLLHILFSVEIKPVFETEATELMIHLFLLEKVDLLRFLLVSFFVETHEFQEKVLTYLLHWLSHKDLAAELRMHGDEGCTIELFESRDKHNLDVFDGQDIEVSQVKLSRTPIDKELTVNTLKECSAVRGLHLRQLGKSLAWGRALTLLGCGIRRGELTSSEHASVEHS